MATIKSYSDLEQSKKLAEILPLESADYTRLGKDEDNVLTRPYFESCSSELKEWIGKDEMSPCWSLAALMEIIRTKSFNRQSGFFIGKTEPYCVFCGSECQTKVHNEPVDACYEMVLKLHELNLL